MHLFPSCQQSCSEPQPDLATSAHLCVLAFLDKKNPTSKQFRTLVMEREMKKKKNLLFVAVGARVGGVLLWDNGLFVGKLPICLSWILPSHPQCTCNCPQYCEERKNGILVMKPICPSWEEEEEFLTYFIQSLPRYSLPIDKNCCSDWMQGKVKLLQFQHRREPHAWNLQESILWGWRIWGWW